MDHRLYAPVLEQVQHILLRGACRISGAMDADTARKELAQIERDRPSRQQSDVDKPATVSKRAKSGDEPIAANTVEHEVDAPGAGEASCRRRLR